MPVAGSRVLIRSGHRVVYDIDSDQAIRGITVAGELSFATDKDTRLDVGLINIQAIDEYSESGFDCDMHFADHDSVQHRPTLEVGTLEQPVDARHTALIRLVYFAGMDKDAAGSLFSGLLADPVTLLLWHSAFMLVTVGIVSMGMPVSRAMTSAIWRVM